MDYLETTRKVLRGRIPDAQGLRQRGNEQSGAAVFYYFSVGKVRYC